MTASRYASRLLLFAVILFCASFLVTVGFIRAANAAVDIGPPPGHGNVTCEQFAFDPDPGVNITATVTLDGKTFPPVSVHADYFHQATWIWTPAERAILDQPGPHHYAIALTWNIGTGTTIVTGDLTCVEPPETTTTEPTTTTTVPETSSTTIVPPHDTDHPVPPAAVTPPTDCDATPTPASCLPHTGTTPGPLALGGACALGIGALIVRKFRPAR